MKAGDLYEKVAFESQATEADGHGGTRAAWAEQFVCRAGYRHVRGSETIQAARLAGTHIQVITVRASAETRAVTTDWRIRDTRTGDLYQIRDVTPSLDRLSLEFLCERGVAI